MTYNTEIANLAPTVEEKYNMLRCLGFGESFVRGSASEGYTLTLDLEQLMPKILFYLKVYNLDQQNINSSMAKALLPRVAKSMEESYQKYEWLFAKADRNNDVETLCSDLLASIIEQECLPDAATVSMFAHLPSLKPEIEVKL